MVDMVVCVVKLFVTSVEYRVCLFFMASHIIVKLLPYILADKPRFFKTTFFIKNWAGRCIKA